jgi:hypothetical protein
MFVECLRLISNIFFKRLDQPFHLRTVWIAHSHVTEGRAMCSRIARVGTRASFDAEQKNRHQTHRRSHSARMPNIRRASARTLSTHPESRSRGECSAMCGGSIEIRLYKSTADTAR